MCDPMHGNTFLTDEGYKTRDFSDILEDPFQIWLNSMDMEVI